MLSMYYHCFAIISSWKRVGPSFEQSCIPFTQGCFAQWIFRTIFLNFIYEHVRLLFRDHLPLEKGMALHLNKLDFDPFTQGCFVPSLVENGPVVLEKIFKFS